MALKATIYKAKVQIADMDRNLYGDYNLTIARHPSETDERMMIRVLAFALNVPATDGNGALEFAGDLCESDEPSLWQKDLTGRVDHWIEVGQPDDKRLIRASSRAGRVSVYCFSSSVGIWWSGVRAGLERVKNVAVWQAPAEQSRALAGLAQRTMTLDVTVQEGVVWVGDGVRSVEVVLGRLV